MVMPVSNPVLYPNRVDSLERNLAQFRLRFMKNLGGSSGFPNDKDIFGSKFTI